MTIFYDSDNNTFLKICTKYKRKNILLLKKVKETQKYLMSLNILYILLNDCKLFHYADKPKFI